MLNAQSSMIISRDHWSRGPKLGCCESRFSFSLEASVKLNFRVMRWESKPLVHQFVAIWNYFSLLNSSKMERNASCSMRDIEQVDKRLHGIGPGNLQSLKRERFDPICVTSGVWVVYGWPQSEGSRPAAAAPGDLAAVPDLRQGSAIRTFMSPPGYFRAHQNLRTTLRKLIFQRC